MRAPRALLFDYDGVIVDSESLIGRVLIEAFGERGVAIEMDDFSHLVGSSGPANDRAWQRFVRTHLGDEVSVEELDRYIWPRVEAAYIDLEILPGVIELMAAARQRRWSVGLATGSRREALLPRLQRLGLGASFDHITTADDVLYGKPEPEIYLKLAANLGVEPEHCVAIEDSVHGCTAALAAGMTVIACPCDVTRGCAFPRGVKLVTSLSEVTLD